MCKSAAIISILCTLFLAVAGGQETDIGGQGGGYRNYNVKAGPVLFTLGSGVSFQFTDNVNLANGALTPLQSDITVSPSINLRAATEAELESHTQMERLTLNMGVGYSRHLMHPELDGNPLMLSISPESNLGIVVKMGHFTTRISDAFSLQSDPGSDGTLSNVAIFKRFTNTIGVNTNWSVNSKTNVSLGYSHSNLVALSFVGLSGSSLQNPGSLNSSNDSFSLSVASRVASLLTLGCGASTSSSNFPANPSQNTTTVSVGPFAQMIITQYTTANASCGVSKVRDGGMFDSSSLASDSSFSSTTTNYSFSVTNRMNRYYTHTFMVGRYNQVDILGQQTISDSATYSSTWRMNSKFTIGTSIFAEDSTSLGGVYVAPHYRRYGCMIGTARQLSRKLSSSISYQYTNKISDDPSESYKANTVLLNFSYAF